MLSGQDLERAAQDCFTRGLTFRKMETAAPYVHVIYWHYSDTGYDASWLDESELCISRIGVNVCKIGQI